MAMQNDHEQEQQHEDIQGRDPNVQHALHFLQHLASRAAPSIEQAGQGFYDSLVLHGLKLDRAEHGRIVCSLNVPPRISNEGLLHGGAIASLVDVVGSAAIYATGVKYTGVSVEINVTYMASVPSHEEIEIDARTLTVGRDLAVVSVDLKNRATGVLIAQGRHTKYLGSSKNIARSRL